MGGREATRAAMSAAPGRLLPYDVIYDILAGAGVSQTSSGADGRGPEWMDVGALEEEAHQRRQLTPEMVEECL
eukprot:13576408-Alexandrium_andersonii.AAC.1